MSRRRGFLAELQHQSEVAARQRRQAANAAARAQAAANRSAEQARRQFERAQQTVARSASAHAKAAAKEAQRLYDEARSAEAAAQTAALESTLQQIDGMLAESLRGDPTVDLDSLRRGPEYPPFPYPELETPVASPAPKITEPEPVFYEVEPPGRVSRLLGGKKKHAEMTAQARGQFELAHEAWRVRMSQATALQISQHEAAEMQRVQRLAQERSKHANVCKQIDAESVESNKTIDRLCADLERGLEYAVQEHVGIVLGKSVYPDGFSVDHDLVFDSDTGELTATVLVRGPAEMPTERAFKYVKASGQITSSSLPKTEQRQRYANAVSQVALRTLHEVFAGDQHGWIKTVALTVACDAIDPATGLTRRANFVRMAADRSTFAAINLVNVVPSATLQHLGAVVSKNPFDLVGVDDSAGVRRL